MDWGVIIVIVIVVVITAIYSGISAAFKMLIGLLLGWGAYCALRRIISRFLSKKDAGSAESSKQAEQPTGTPQLKPSVTNLVESIINTGDNKAYFDDGVVYAVTQNGEFKIGYYDYDKAYDQHKKEIASFSQHDDGILIILNHRGTIKEMEATYTENAEKEQEPGMKEAWLRLLQKDRVRFQGHDTAWATDTGTIEETDDYNKVAYLHNRTNNMAKDRILGMAAAFVCLQNFTYDENRYSKFYHNL